MKFHLNFTTDFGQFYVSDKNAKGQTSSDNFWTDQAFEDKLAVEEGVLGIGITNSGGLVDCFFEILDSKNLNNDFSEFDHIVEASLKISSGILQVLDCPFSEIEMETKIENGDYRIRVYSCNLNSTYNENPKDFYKIEIWKETLSERIVLKRYNN